MAFLESPGIASKPSKGRTPKRVLDWPSLASLYGGLLTCAALLAAKVTGRGYGRAGRLVRPLRHALIGRARALADISSSASRYPNASFKKSNTLQACEDSSARLARASRFQSQTSK